MRSFAFTNGSPACDRLRADLAQLLEEEALVEAELNTLKANRKRALALLEKFGFTWTALPSNSSSSLSLPFLWLKVLYLFLMLMFIFTLTFIISGFCVHLWLLLIIRLVLGSCETLCNFVIGICSSRLDCKRIVLLVGSRVFDYASSKMEPYFWSNGTYPYLMMHLKLSLRGRGSSQPAELPSATEKQRTTTGTSTACVALVTELLIVFCNKLTAWQWTGIAGWLANSWFMFFILSWEGNTRYL